MIKSKPNSSIEKIVEKFLDRERRKKIENLEERKNRRLQWIKEDLKKYYQEEILTLETKINKLFQEGHEESSLKVTERRAEYIHICF